MAAAVRVFISYAHDDAEHEARVRGLWLLLRANGIDARLDAPADDRPQDWSQWMLDQVEAAAFTLVIASPAYRRRAEGSEPADVGRGARWEAQLVKQAWYAHRDIARARFLPVVLPGCSPEDIPIWMDRETGTHYRVTDYTLAGAETLIRYLTSQPAAVVPPIGRVPHLPPRSPGSSPGSTTAAGPPRQEHQRARLLNRLQQSYDTFHLQSLASTIRLELGLVQMSLDDPGAVTPTVPVHQSRRILPRGTTLATVFASVGGMDSDGLLVLGAPGGGKTTLLIEMAQELVREAVTRPSTPIPIYLPLSAWGARRPDLGDWLEERLLSLYKVPRALSREWLDHRGLLLLLDGLDEVGDLNARRRCLKEIDALSRDKNSAVVVSSRLDDYRPLAGQARFSATLEVLPCDPSDVLRQMRQSGTQMRGVISMVEDHPTLVGLLSTPFFVSVLSLTYLDTPQATAGSLHAREQQRDQLISNLIDRRLEVQTPQGPDGPRLQRYYPPERTRHWLVALARQLSSTGETVFQLERLNTSWLASPLRRRLVLAAPKVVFAIVLGIANLFVTRALAQIVGVTTSPVFHLLTWIAFGVVADLVGRYPLSRRLVAWSAFGAVSGLVFAMIVREYGMWGMLVEPLYFAALFGLVGEMLVHFVKEELGPAELLSWSWSRAREGFFRRLWIGSLVGVPYGLLFGVSTHVSQGWFGIRTSILFGVAMFGPIFGMLWGAGNGLVTGLNTGPIPVHIAPNEGMRRSARNGARTAVAAFLAATAVVIGGFFFIEAVYPVAAAQPVPAALSAILIGLNCGLGVGLLWGLASGLGALVQNGVLRVLLWSEGTAPLCYVRWLEHVVRLRIMYRIGGGYVFMHRIVQEYLIAP